MDLMGKNEYRKEENMKKFNVKFKDVRENEIEVTAENRNDALEKAKELFRSDLKDKEITPLTRYYYVVEINNKEMLVKKKIGGEK